MEMVYKQRPGFRLKTSAEVVGKRLDELADGNRDHEGRPCVTPELVVDDAHEEESPLKPEFADLESVEECIRVAWIQRAQHLLGATIRIYIEEDGTKNETLSYVRIVEKVERPDGTSERQRVYVSPEIALKDPDHREQVIADATRYLAGAQERLRLIKVAEKEIGRIEQIKKRLARLAKHPKTAPT